MIPRNAQVMMCWEGSTLLGDVVGYYEASDGPRLVVRYFNGQPWPVDPLESACTVLPRTYDSE